MTPFQKEILQGIPDQLPAIKPYDSETSHAPKRVIDGVLSLEEKKLAVRNALRYFPAEHHPILATEFAKELEDLWAHIYAAIPASLCHACSAL